MSQAVDYKCPNCGSALVFDPGLGRVRCQGCGSTFDPPAAPVEPLGPAISGGAKAAVAARAAEAAAPTGLSQVECRSCGAQIVVATQTEASTTCAYCHSPVVLVGQLSGGLAPDTVVPFSIRADQAREIFDRWISKKRYVQAGFYSRRRIDKLDGVYFPYFAVDAQADVQVEGTAHFTTGAGKYQRDHYFHVLREGEVQIENLPQEALRANRADKMINRLLPWDMTKQVPFAPQYLAGFQTERRDLDFGQVAVEVGHHLDLASRRLMATDVFQGDKRLRDMKLWGVTKIRRWRHRYTLLPAWVLFYTAPGGELYYFGINGQTGEAAGRLPINEGKLKRDAFLISAAGGLVVLAGLAAMLAGF
ncbi:MAG: TFIIB-type zinc ribbon-containing protein [Bifidobacteriaceae bacterium]|jgi:DNA-directed RNA polymerase subunit RPC12/RpoP|nr:TFIIB-type zinc ribbon-containing protein [Bifidobacteriaceae bacterium]